MIILVQSKARIAGLEGGMENKEEKRGKKQFGRYIGKVE